MFELLRVHMLMYGLMDATSLRLRWQINLDLRHIVLTTPPRLLHSSLLSLRWLRYHFRRRHKTMRSLHILGIATSVPVWGAPFFGFVFVSFCFWLLGRRSVFLNCGTLFSGDWRWCRFGCLENVHRWLRLLLNYLQGENVVDSCCVR